MKFTNHFVYFFGYFAQGLLLVVFNTYLPVLLVTVLNIPEGEIAFAQFISYAAFFIKPIFALLSDQSLKKGNYPKRRIFVFSGSIGLIISFLFMIISVQMMIIFGIFWGINYFCMSIMDVAIDGSIIDTSRDIQSKERKIVLIQVGNSSGNIIGSLLYILLITNIHNVFEWNTFFIFQLFTLTPLIIFSYFMYEGKINNKDKNEILSEKSDDPTLSKKESMKVLDEKHLIFSFVFMCIFLIIFYSEALVQVPYENWLIMRFGQEGFELYAFFLIFAPIISVVGYLLKSIVFKYSNRKKILYISLIIIGLFDMCIPLMNLWTLIILGMFALIPNAIAYITFISIMMEFAGDKNSYKYQILATMVIISRIIFGPMGTLLSGFIDTSILLIILGFLILSSIIPIIFIKMKTRDIS